MLDIQYELIFVNGMVHLPQLCHTNNSPFTSYTTVTPHSDSRSDFSAYVTSHVQYTTYEIIACIERATMLRANIMRVTRECKAGEGVLKIVIQDWQTDVWLLPWG